MNNLSPAALVTQEVREWLEVDDDLVPVVPLVAAVANKLQGPPVWLMIVDAPSSAKTELLMAVAKVPQCRWISKLTDKTMASGKKREAGDVKHLSFLEELSANGTWLLIIKDFGTILSLPDATRNGLLADFREICDGTYYARYGTGVTVDWEGKLGLLVAATPAVDRLHKWNAELGERFVQFRPHAPDPRRVGMLIMRAEENDKQRRSALAAAYTRAFQKAVEQIKSPECGVLGPEAGLIINELTQFVTQARRAVYRPRLYDSAFEVGGIEGPARLMKVLGQLYRAAMICYAGDADASVRLVIRIGLDSTPGKRGRALRELARGRDGVTAQTVADVLECDSNTADRLMRDLEALGLATRCKPGKRVFYQASTELLDMAARIFLDEFEGQDALSKLFDLPIHLTPERERERVGV